MMKAIRASWFNARALGALQTYFDLPYKHPLPLELADLLDESVERTLKDGGTPIDAALRFYAAYADKSVRIGLSLDDINFFGALGRMMALRDKMKFYSEHHQALKRIGEEDLRNQ